MNSERFHGNNYIHSIEGHLCGLPLIPINQRIISGKYFLKMGTHLVER